MSSSIFAYFHGAEIIEKHFTLDNNYSRFRDHKLSLNPKDMKYLVKFFNEFAKMNVPLKKEISRAENSNLLNLRRSYYFNQNLQTGEKNKNSSSKVCQTCKKKGYL